MARNIIQFQKELSDVGFQISTEPRSYRGGSASPTIALAGTYRHASSKHVPRYLAEFQYRFNRGNDLAGLLTRLAWVSLRTPPMPYRLIKLAESHG